jgi:hypothetical protein
VKKARRVAQRAWRWARRAGRWAQLHDRDFYSFFAVFREFRFIEHHPISTFKIQRLDIRYSSFFFISFSENSDSSDIAPLQHSRLGVGYSIFLFLLSFVFG